jgi:hypothetical protein
MILRYLDVQRERERERVLTASLSDLHINLGALCKTLNTLSVINAHHLELGLKLKLRIRSSNILLLCISLFPIRYYISR